MLQKLRTPSFNRKRKFRDSNTDTVSDEAFQQPEMPPLEFDCARAFITKDSEESWLKARVWHPGR